ncbi:MAG TPA: formylglycine-generating enzyme family protein [Chitinophagaceae bacterium]|nr:formylglycine-generating enzyme family protein [Chitinophagaceae bacterium]
MDEIQLKFDEINYTFPLVFVQGTGENHFRFGLENDQLKMSTKNFFISKYPVTQILWKHIMGHNPSHFAGDHKPVETVSYIDITSEQGFLKKVNTKSVQDQIRKQIGASHSIQLRLPTEAEWEYAARGGIYWGDYFIYSGSDNIDEVGWYKYNSNNESKVVGQKKPNQLGIHDMSGNLWEWCYDYYQRGTKKIPLDGTPCLEESPQRVLRGGCFHNGGIHCTVMKRYEINPDYKDECIGFRIVLAI